MEDESAEFRTNLDEIDTKRVTTIQALIRGVLVRKWMKEVRQSFTEVVTDLESYPNVGVEWCRKTVCVPKVTRRRNKAPKVKKSDDQSKELVQNVDVTAKSKTGDVQKDENYVTNSGLNSVETQTSFIEIIKPATSVIKSEDIETTDILSHLKKDTAEQELTYNAKKSVDVHLSLEDVEAESDHPDSVRSQSLPSESEDRLSPSPKPKFDSLGFEENKDLSIGDESDARDSDRKSDESAKPNKFIDSLALRHVTSDDEDLVTKVEEFHALGSDRSRHSTRSVKSVRSNKSHRSSGSGKPINDSGRSNDLNRDILFTEKELESDRSTKSQRSHKSNNSKGKARTPEQYEDERPVSGRSQHSQRSNRSQGSQSRPAQRDIQPGQSFERARSPASDRSETSVKSHRSDRSQKSSRSQKSDKSHMSEASQRSERSHMSESSQKSRRSKTADSPRLDGDINFVSPRPSSVSPVPVSRREGKSSNVHTIPRSSNQDSTTLTNVTSVWDSINSFAESHEFQMPSSLPEDPNILREVRKNISMELLWVQQAINSRKNYLKLKNKM